MKSISFSEFWANRENYRLIDVREANEFAEVRVKGAESHALSRIQNGDLPEFDERAVALICKMGGRSAVACQLIESAGIGDCTNVDGGTMAAVNIGEEMVDRG